MWKTIAFPDVKNKRDAEKRLAILVGDRERGSLRLPKRANVPTLAEYCVPFLENAKNGRENTYLGKKKSCQNINEVFGEL